MKKLCNISLFCFIFSTLAQSQVLRKEIINDTTFLKIIADYNAESHNNRWFYEDKGVLSMSIQHTDTLDIYKFQTYIDDRFMDNPPNSYAHAFGTILLIYDVDAKGNVLQNKISKKDSLFLLEEIGSRIYTKPKVQEFWVEMRISATEFKRQKFKGPRIIALGGGTQIDYHRKGTTYKKRWHY